MGLLDFVKSAGKKLLGVEDEAEVRREAELDAREAEQRKRMQKAKREAALANELEALGLEIEDLRIDFNDSVVTVRGTAASQEIREKAAVALGNVAGVAAVDDLMEVSSDAPVTRYHTVVSGDTLSKIAKEMYGNAMKYPVIFEANRPMLEHPDKIYPGQVLRIPALED